MPVNCLKFVLMLLVVSVVLGGMPLLAYDAGPFGNLSEDSVLLDTLNLQQVFDSKDIPAGGIIKSIEGNLRVAYLIGDDGRQYLLLTSKNAAAEQDVKIMFAKNVVLREISVITGLPRRRGNQAEWRMFFYPDEAKLFEWLPGELEPANLRPRVALNPSCQYANVIEDDQGKQLYNEGNNMWLYAVKIKEYLDRDGRVDAFITRRSQMQASKLGWETGVAKLAQADALVSLHSDATGNGTPGGGSWTFYHGEEGKRLASLVQGEVLEAIKEVYPEVKPLGIREHWSRLHVLHNSGCPSSLTEVLFHTNPKEREMLKDPAFQDRISKAFAEGILKYFGFDGLKVDIPH